VRPRQPTMVLAQLACAEDVHLFTWLQVAQPTTSKQTVSFISICG